MLRSASKDADNLKGLMHFRCNTAQTQTFPRAPIVTGD